MKNILTALTAATVLALALTANAQAGRHVSHTNPHPNQSHNNQFVNNSGKFISNGSNLKVHHDKSDMHGRRHDFLRSDFRSFRYRCWCPNCDAYIFWYPSDSCWYYWCASRGCYLPYDQISVYPPVADVIPQIPGGLPPAVPGSDDGPSTGDDGPPPMPPADVRAGNPKTVRNGPPPGPPANPFDN